MTFTEVTTRHGRFRGVRRNDVDTFRGIRYALADRFEPPRDPPTNVGTVDAIEPGAECPQLEGMLAKHLGLFTTGLPHDEDCLFLNVTTPGCDAAGRPVVVWIHGGAFTSGGGANPWYDGAALARRHGIVIVTINYRLGILGFLGRRNCGTLDQLAALRWVHDTIEVFGGDPGNVTLAGASAGGASVIALLATTAGSSMCHRAFLSSPSIGQIRAPGRADQVHDHILSLAEISTIDPLRHADLADLMNLQAAVLATPDGGFSGFSPCADGTLIPERFHDAAAAAYQPLVIGTTQDEMQLFAATSPPVDDDALHRQLVGHFGDDAALHLYRQHRHLGDNRFISAAIESDRVLHVPARRLAEARVMAGTPTWSYRFTWRSTAKDGALGSCHGLDVPFLFDNVDAAEVERFTGPAPGRADVAEAFSTALASLAHHGSPGWARYDLQTRPSMRIDVESGIVNDVDADRRALWDRHMTTS